MTGGPRARGEGKPSDFIQSVSRALRIMEVVGQSRHGLTIKQIARRCQLAPTTTYHLVRTLTYESYLIKGEHGLFTMGLAVSDRFREFAATIRGPANVVEALRRQVSDTGYSHYLARFVDGRVAITEVSEGSRSPHTEDLIVGFDDGAHATAVGKALLATLPAEERRRYLRESGMRRYTARTYTALDDLERDLAGMSGHGMFTETGQYRDGLGCAATLVNPNAPISQRTAVACTIPLDDLSQAASALKSRLDNAAMEIATALDEADPR